MAIGHLVGRTITSYVAANIGHRSISQKVLCVYRAIIDVISHAKPRVGSCHVIRMDCEFMLAQIIKP